MPGLIQFRTETEPTLPNSSPHPEDEELWLPSRIPAARRGVVCMANLPTIEDKLRTAQCKDSLDGLRHVLRIKTRMVQFKNKNVRGQHQGTRSRTVIDRVHNRARNFADKYHAARAAKYRLVGGGPWEQSLRILLDSDIRSYSDACPKPKLGRRKGTLEDDELEALEGREENGEGHPMTDDEDGINLLPQAQARRDGTGETRKELSWIWRTPGIAVDGAGSIENDNPDILWSEWAKSRARAARATEEVILVREEMQRTLAYLEWKSKWWLARRVLRVCSDRAMAEGISAYASQQAQLQAALASNFRILWTTPLDEIGEDDTGDNERDDNDDPDTDSDSDASEDENGVQNQDSDSE
jgi:hypothetical protein